MAALLIFCFSGCVKQQQKSEQKSVESDYVVLKPGKYISSYDGSYSSSSCISGYIEIDEDGTATFINDPLASFYIGGQYYIYENQLKISGYDCAFDIIDGKLIYNSENTDFYYDADGKAFIHEDDYQEFIKNNAVIRTNSIGSRILITDDTDVCKSIEKYINLQNTELIEDEIDYSEDVFTIQYNGSGAIIDKNNDSYSAVKKIYETEKSYDFYKNSEKKTYISKVNLKNDDEIQSNYSSDNRVKFFKALKNELKNNAFDDCLSEYDIQQLKQAKRKDCINISPPGAKDRLGIEVFSVDMSYSFLFDGKKVSVIGNGFGSRGIESLAVCDIDCDGEYELIYIYSFGSGLHYQAIGMLKSNGEKYAVVTSSNWKYDSLYAVENGNGCDVYGGVREYDEEIGQASFKIKEKLGSVRYSENDKNPFFEASAENAVGETSAYQFSLY